MSDTDRRRHPVRGALWGAVAGIGAALFLIGRAVIAFGTLAPIVVIVVFAVLGVLWGSFGPARSPKGEPPYAAPAPVEASAGVSAAPADEVSAADDSSGASEPGET